MDKKLRIRLSVEEEDGKIIDSKLLNTDISTLPFKDLESLHNIDMAKELADVFITSIGFEALPFLAKIIKDLENKNG